MMNATTTNKTNLGGQQGKNDLAAFNPLGVLVRRRWQLFGCLLVVCGIAFAVTVMRKPKYQATARVQMVMDQPKMGGMAAMMGGGNNDYFTTQCQLLQSRHVLARAAEKLNLSGGHWAYSDEGIKTLQESLRVKPVGGSRLIDITGVAATGAEAAAIANGVTASFIETSKEARQAANTRTVGRVNAKIADYKREIEEKTAGINKFRQENLITGADSAWGAVERRIAVTENELTKIRMERLALEAQRDHFKKMLTSGRGLGEEDAVPPEIDRNPTVNSLRQSIQKLQEEEAQLAQAYLPGHQNLRTTRMRIADLQGRLLDQKRRLLQSSYEQAMEYFTSTVKREDSLLMMLQQQKETGVKLGERHQEYGTMLADLAMARRFRDECIGRVRQFTLEEGMAEAPVMVVSAAHIPRKPAGMTKPHRAASILILGLLFSVVFVFAMDRFMVPPEIAAEISERIYAPPAAMGASMGSVPWWPYMTPMTPYGQTGNAAPATMSPMITTQIGTIDFAGGSYDDPAFAARCRIVHTDQQCRQAEAFRQLSTELLSRFGRARQSIVATAANAKSGTTTCAANLALMLAQSGRKVVLVDANVKAPALDRIFAQNTKKPDLDAVLTDENLLEEALQESGIANLAVLYHSEGEEWRNHSDTNSLSKLHSQLSQRFDWVIYDAADLQEEFTRNLLQAVGKSLFVWTPADREDPVAMMKQVELCGAISIGCIENAPALNPQVSQDKKIIS